MHDDEIELPRDGQHFGEAQPFRRGIEEVRLSGTSAAGCASQVGYQKERISRFA